MTDQNQTRNFSGESLIQTQGNAQVVGGQAVERRDVFGNLIAETPEERAQREAAVRANTPVVESGERAPDADPQHDQAIGNESPSSTIPVETTGDPRIPATATAREADVLRGLIQPAPGETLAGVTGPAVASGPYKAPKVGDVVAYVMEDGTDREALVIERQDPSETVTLLVQVADPFTVPVYRQQFPAVSHGTGPGQWHEVTSGV